MLGAADWSGVKVWNMASRRLVGVFPGHHDGFANRLAFSADTKLVACGLLNSVRLYDMDRSS